MRTPASLLFFFFNDTATTEIYTLSLHDALPISGSRAPAAHGRHDASSSTCRHAAGPRGSAPLVSATDHRDLRDRPQDRKSTRLNSSHSQISYAVFCLKKKIKGGTLHAKIDFHID